VVSCLTSILGDIFMTRRTKTRAKDGADRVKMALEHLKKNFGANVIKNATESLSVKEVISTGHKSLDEAIGAGGLPLGVIVELFGPEASGKGVLSMSICAQAQKEGLNVLWVDAEHQCNPDWMSTNGIDLDAIDMMDGFLSAEDTLEAIEEMVLAGAYSLVVVDSLAALIPEIELDKKIGDTQVGRMGAIMSNGCRKLAQACAKSNCTIIFINQVREKIGVMFGNPETTPGGKALGFYSSLRFRINKTSEKINKDDSQIGVWSKVKVIKNRFGIPHKEAMISIYFMEYNPSSLEKFMDFAKNCGVIRKHQGSNFKFSSFVAETVLDLAPILAENESMKDLVERIRKACAKKNIEIDKQDEDIVKVIDAITSDTFKIEDFV
jgi:recombination protein RecA